ncbi:hypothetical protein R1flu_016357 [Riccia fluitans]|uniref:Magnesium-protoporphyrin IX methyltransferase C-terminal domain-containing protein n=1 Tax=Riccia fluitans TaxID=41844 RepID=A0ABD1YM35_9MARC
MASTVKTSFCSSCGALSSSSSAAALTGQRLQQKKGNVNCSGRGARRESLEGLAVRAVSVPVEDGGSLGFAVASGGAIAALAIALADPQKRREKDAQAAGGDEMESVRSYFNTQGFERWKKIYGETDDVNKVQLDIRIGHAQTVEKTMAFLKGGDGLKGVTVCDAGCGTGSLTIPLCEEGAVVNASDISSSMVEEAERRAAVVLEKNPQLTKPVFQAQDLESITGKYHTVVCLDVLIHYPQEKAAGMIAHLASRADKRLLLSFAPKTPYYSVLKRIGELFPGPSKATRAYLHAEEDVEQALNAVGWKVTRREMTATKFYFSRLLEAVPASS